MTSHSFTSIAFTLIPRFMSEASSQLDGTLLEGSFSTYLVVATIRLAFLMCNSYIFGLNLRQLYFYCSVTLAYPMLVNFLIIIVGAVFGFLVCVCSYTGMNYLTNSIFREIRGHERERLSLV
ncbi:hypothetical protein F5H01DRAFT_341844 [Linnemannia elongata]|nr:hypothetical protein F5H01DRAFT_341844 [Linnemannia elongata]